MRFALLTIETNKLCTLGKRFPGYDILQALKINFTLPLSQRNIGEAERLFDRALRCRSRVNSIQGEDVLIGLYLLLHRCCILVRKAQLNHQRTLFRQALGHIDDSVMCLTVFLTDSKEECDAVRPGTQQEESYCEALYLLRYGVNLREGIIYSILLYDNRISPYEPQTVVEELRGIYPMPITVGYTTCSVNGFIHGKL